MHWLQAFWKENGFSGDILSSGGKPVLPGMTSGPLQAVMDASTPNGNPALVGFFADVKEWRSKPVSVNNTECQSEG